MRKRIDTTWMIHDVSWNLPDTTFSTVRATKPMAMPVRAPALTPAALST